jgi:hypothetical protein
MTAREGARSLLVVVSVVALQLSLVMDLWVGGAHANLVVGLAVAAGLAGGVERGAVVGFVSGLGVDLFLPDPLGLSALVGTVVGAATGQLLAAGVDRSNPAFVPGVAAIGSASGVMLFAVLSALFGQPGVLTVHLVVVVVVVSVVNALVSIPLVRLCGWAFATDERSARSVWRGSLVTGDR